MQKNLILAIVGVAVIAAGIYFISTRKGGNPQNTPTPTPTPNLAVDIFAKCLTEKGAKFYGAWWCPHCVNQKVAFGGSMQYINYIECENFPGSSKGNLVDACKDAKITGYPTWDFAGGHREIGEVSFSKLSELTGCGLPEITQ